MNNFGFKVNNGLTVGDNVRIGGMTLNFRDLVSMSYAADIPITESPTVVDSTSKSVTRGAKYQIEIMDGTNYQISELLLVHDGEDSKLVEYGVLTADGLPMATFTTNINGTDVRLIAQMHSGNGRLWFSKTSINSIS